VKDKKIKKERAESAGILLGGRPMTPLKEKTTIRWASTASVLIIAFISMIVFQNCDVTKHFGGGASTPNSSASGNGDGYDGKTYYGNIRVCDAHASSPSSGTIDSDRIRVKSGSIEHIPACGEGQRTTVARNEVMFSGTSGATDLAVYKTSIYQVMSEPPRALPVNLPNSLWPSLLCISEIVDRNGTRSSWQVVIFGQAGSDSSDASDQEAEISIQENMSTTPPSSPFTVIGPRLPISRVDEEDGTWSFTGSGFNLNISTVFDPFNAVASLPPEGATVKMLCTGEGVSLPSSPPSPVPNQPPTDLRDIIPQPDSLPPVPTPTPPSSQQ